MKCLSVFLGIAAMSLAPSVVSAASLDDDLDTKLDGRSDRYERPESNDRRDRGDRDRRDRRDRSDRNDYRDNYRNDNRYGDRRYSGANGYRTQNLYCQSRDRRREVCRVPNSAVNVRFGDRRSDAPCRQGRDWGISRNQVWVMNGCRAYFTVTFRDDYYRDGSYGGGYGDGRYNNDGLQYVTCESKDGRGRTCHLPRGGEGLRMVRRKSDAPCRQGRDWGVRGGSVWVKNGCRATFAVRVDYGRYSRR